ncbi:hypothetical protein D082_50580 (plasmid) [Synechocystis sp. PCC 6714]|nr:hypothetical protein D082_50580 [Synechocystis sp. PCC 6714]
MLRNKKYLKLFVVTTASFISGPSCFLWRSPIHHRSNKD